MANRASPFPVFLTVFLRVFLTFLVFGALAASALASAAYAQPDTGGAAGDSSISAGTAVDAGAEQAGQEGKKNRTGDSADYPVVIYHFYGQGCPHCARMKIFLDELEDRFPSVEIKRYEIYQDQNNRDEYFALSAAYGLDVEKMPVPITFIGDKVFAGFTDAVEEEVRAQVDYCLSNLCTTKEPKTGTVLDTVTIPVVIAAAAVDAINPCAFAVLIILLSTILAAGSRRKALLAGLAFSLSVFISYLLMGIGLYSAIQVANVTGIIYTAVAVLAIIVGLFNLKDYLWYGKWFRMEVPMAWRPKMKLLLKGVTSVPGAFLVGILISLFLLPCTSGPYIVILGLLSETATRTSAIPLLTLYNLVFVLPMILITLAIYFGFTTTLKAEEWRKRKLKVLHLIAGIIILLIGVFMLAALYFGWI